MYTRVRCKEIIPFIRSDSLNDAFRYLLTPYRDYLNDAKGLSE